MRTIKLDDFERDFRQIVLARKPHVKAIGAGDDRRRASLLVLTRTQHDDEHRVEELVALLESSSPAALVASWRT